MVKNLPAMQETRAQSLGREDPLEESMATLSSILAWEIPWREEPGGLQSTGSQRIGHNGRNLAHMHARSISFLPLEVPNHYSQHPLLSLTEDGI